MALTSRISAGQGLRLDDPRKRGVAVASGGRRGWWEGVKRRRVQRLPVPCGGIGFGGEEQPRDGHVTFASGEHQEGAWAEQA
jgi:hypothetical protein